MTCLAAFISLWVVSAALAGTSPIYVNNQIVISPPALPPQIDATAFDNRARFEINNFSFLGFPVGTVGFILGNFGLPYETANTLHFTNQTFIDMIAVPGFRFDFTTNGFRYPMANWVNRGSIQASTRLVVEATNLISSGPFLMIGEQGIMKLKGSNVNLSRVGIRSGPMTNTAIFAGGITFIDSYVNDFAIADVYWGGGFHNGFTNPPPPVLLSLSQGNWDPSLIGLFGSPSHLITQVNPAGGQVQTVTTVPGFGGLFGSNFIGAARFFKPYVYSNFLSPTQSFIQVVYAPSNALDTNISIDVNFVPDGGLGAEVIIDFSATDTDLVLQSPQTSHLYFVDGTSLMNSNVLFANLNIDTFRPNTMAVTRFTPFNLGFGFTVSSNFPFAPELIYDPATYRSNRVVSRYSAYAALSDVSVTTQAGAAGGVVNPVVSDPTNYPGRVEIIADRLDLNQARIRSEAGLIVRAKDLTSNHVARVDAPFINYEFTSKQPRLTITNLVPSVTRRLAGQLFAWSGFWTNFQDLPTTTNELIFHVLIVDEQLRFAQPVALNEFIVHSTNLVVSDNLNVSKIVLIEAENLHVTGGITLPPGVFWASTNIQRLVNLTNDGTIAVSQRASFGADRPEPYSNIVNRGFISSGVNLIRTRNLVNSRSISASGGGIDIVADTVDLSGPVENFTTLSQTNIFFDFFRNTFVTNVFTTFITNTFAAELKAHGDVSIAANTFIASNSVIVAGVVNPAAIILNVTNNLSDAGIEATNRWIGTAGFHMLRRPQNPGTNLFGTHLTSAPRFQFLETTHTWAAEDRGRTTNGFVGNVALGRVTLDGPNGALFSFAGPGTNASALYVDFLELLNYATNFAEAIRVETNLTIYFANSNIPAEKLDAVEGGRLRWVPDFMGPLSTTNITYVITNSMGVVTTNVHAFNSELVLSKNRDDDCDGTVNGEDPTPIFTEDNLDLNITITNLPPVQACVSWIALCKSVNTVEFKNTVQETNWMTLQTLTNTSTLTFRTNVVDMSPMSGQRIYRVRFDPPPLIP